MKQLADRLRAALSTPGARALLITLALFLLCTAVLSQRTEETSLEARIARTLSAMEGAGQVSVVIRTRETPGSGSTGLFSSDAAKETVPCGAVAVA